MLLLLIIICILIALYILGNFRAIYSGGAELVDYAEFFKNKSLAREFLEEAQNSNNVPPTIKFSEIKHQLDYVPKIEQHIPTNVVHIGQRKLFLSELQFLTKYYGEKIFVVYAGAAPSNHTGYLGKFFPLAQFLLVDPNKFDVREADSVYLLKSEPKGEELEGAIKTFFKGENQINLANCFFTQEMAEMIAKHKGKNKVLFISDIRSEHGESPLDIDIIWNLAQQYIWVSVIKPEASMLKFRHPFYADNSVEKFKNDHETEFKLAKKLGIDFLASYQKKEVVYFDGDLYIQAWPGVSSTEVRLVSIKPDKTKIHKYGASHDYENSFYYYNTIKRQFMRHYNPLADPEIGFDSCGDCALEYHIWKEYNDNCRKIDIKECILHLSKITKRSLFIHNHGKFF